MDRDIRSVTGQVAETIINDQVIYQLPIRTPRDCLKEEAPSLILPDLEWILEHSTKVSAKDLLWAWRRKALAVNDRRMLVRQNCGLHYGTAWTVLIFTALSCVGISDIFSRTREPMLWLCFPVAMAIAFWCLAYTAWPQVTAKHAIKVLKEKPLSEASKKLSPEQLEVYTRIRRLPQKAANDVFAFMETHFETRLVYAIQPDQLRRLKGYVDGIYRNRDASRRRSASISSSQVAQQPRYQQDMKP